MAADGVSNGKSAGVGRGFVEFRVTPTEVTTPSGNVALNPTPDRKKADSNFVDGMAPYTTMIEARYVSGLSGSTPEERAASLDAGIKAMGEFYDQMAAKLNHPVVMIELRGAPVTSEDVRAHLDGLLKDRPEMVVALHSGSPESASEQAHADDEVQSFSSRTVPKSAKNRCLRRRVYGLRHVS
jgi:23S rRNA pseudoU1915 N3-methylase RlmH